MKQKILQVPPAVENELEGVMRQLQRFDTKATLDTALQQVLKVGFVMFRILDDAESRIVIESLEDASTNHWERYELTIGKIAEFRKIEPEVTSAPDIADAPNILST